GQHGVLFFFFAGGGRHRGCPGTGVQTCALPIWPCPWITTPKCCAAPPGAVLFVGFEPGGAAQHFGVVIHGHGHDRVVALCLPFRSEERRVGAVGADRSRPWGRRRRRDGLRRGGS